MLQKLLIATLTIMLLAASRAGAKPAETLTQNVFTTAESLDAGLAQAGANFSFGEGYRSFYPSIRYGFGSLFEAGARVGVSTVDTWTEDKLAALIGADLKYQLVKSTEGVPVDMALDVGFDNHIISGKNVSELTFAAIFSRSFPLTERGYKVTPYGGLQVSALYGSYFREDNTDYYVFAGAEWKISQKTMFYAEVKTGEHTIGGLGVRFEY